MASQYRFGAERNMLEFIGGGVEPGENPENAILREIWEETNISPDQLDITMLSETTMNPSVSKSKLFLFYAEINNNNMNEIYEDCHEHINLHWLTYAQVSDFFANGDASTPSKLLWIEFNNKILNDEMDIMRYADSIYDENIIFCDCDGVLIRNDVNDLEDPEEYYYDDTMME
jgi:NADH pyrophosphatase NudC (nudix superfamily)